MGNESGMRAPVQKTPPRRTGKQTASKAVPNLAVPNPVVPNPAGRAAGQADGETAGQAARQAAGETAGSGTAGEMAGQAAFGTGRPGQAAVGTGRPGRPGQAAVGTGRPGRPARVRNRLIGAVAVVAAAIAGAGAPSILAASGQLNDTQNLVTLAEQTQQALTLAHALSDERDEVTAYVAAGRPKSQLPSEEHSARVDRQVEELEADAPAELRADLDEIASVRRTALRTGKRQAGKSTGKGTALEAHQAYSAAPRRAARPRRGPGRETAAPRGRRRPRARRTRHRRPAGRRRPRTAPRRAERADQPPESVVDPTTGLATSPGHDHDLHDHAHLGRW